MHPPVGFYEPKFNETCKKKPKPEYVDPKYVKNPFLKPENEDLNRKIQDKYIHKAYEDLPRVQAFSAFADTRQVDFAKAQTRDEVSFYKKLARLT